MGTFSSDWEPFEDRVNYGTVSPPPAPAIEGAIYFVTADGTQTGLVQEVWTFDEVLGVWTQHPTGGTSCPAPMTRGALIDLRNAGKLLKECHYVITDYSRGTVGAAIILLHAIDANTLSMAVDVKTTFDDLSWSGRYDINTNRLVEISDNVGNRVSGQEVVDTFPWAAVNVYDNIIEEGAVFTWTSGQFYDNHISASATVTIAGGVVARNKFEGSSNTIVNGGAFYENLIKEDATVTWNAGSCFANNFGGESLFNQAGTLGAFYRNTLAINSNVTLGDTNVFENSFERTTFNTTGSVGSIRYCSFKDCTGLTGLQDVGTLDWAYCSLNNSHVSITGAARSYFRYVTLESYGRILMSAGAQLDMNFTGLREYSYVQVLGGRLYVNCSSLRGVSYINQAATVTGTNRIDSLDCSSHSRVRFLGTVADCRVFYSDVSSGSFIEARGSSTGCYFYYNKVSSASQMYCNNSINLRAYYNALSGTSQFYSQNVTALHYVYYCSLTGHGYIRFYNSMGGTIYAVHCAGQGLVNLYGAANTARLLYSSFMAYYYLNAKDWTISRYGLHGYGRRSYTVTNPAANGTYTQNF